MRHTRSDIERWLTYLHDHDGPEGKIHLVNIYGSLFTPLLGSDDIDHIVAFCAAASSSEEAVSRLKEICGRTPRSLIPGRVPNKDMEPSELYATVVKLESFERHISSGTLSPGLIKTAGYPYPPKGRRPLARREIGRMSKTHTWAKPNATVGAPARGAFGETFCWFTKAAHLRKAIHAITDPDTKATAIRDILGLIHCEHEQEIVQISFPASVIISNPDVMVAEPTFADGGNLRYAAVQGGDQYIENRQDRWGTTVDLWRFRSGHDDCCGGPERISNKIPVDATRFQLDYVGCIMEPRGDTPSDNHVAFAAWLMRHFTPTTYQAMISSIAGKVSK